MGEKEKVPGIIGGMGPEATVDLMQRIIRLTPALDDADHLRCLIDNNPKVPSRIKALLEGGEENPGPHMAATAKGLEAWGADFLAIPCNTAHFYYDYVRQAVQIPVLHMIDLTVEAALRKKPRLNTVGILATPMVRMTRLYEERFAAKGVVVLYPMPDDEVNLFAIIRGVKRGEADTEEREALRVIQRRLHERGAQLCILACTELGVLLSEDEETIDAAEVLAKAIVDYARQGA